MTIITTEKQLRPRDPNDFYPTPDEFVDAALRRVNSLHVRPTHILDPGAGNGVWGTIARRRWSDAHITGVELRDVPKPPAYDCWITGDFRLEQFWSMDLVIGNPPYKHAESFVRYGLHALDQGGVLVYLLRLAFLEGQERGANLWKRLPPTLVEVCSSRPSFTGNGKTDATAYAMYYWRKGWRGETRLGWMQV